MNLNEKQRTWLAALVIAIVCFFNFSQHIYPELIVDDSLIITGIPYHSIENIPDFFKARTQSHHYRPLSSAVGTVLYHFFGENIICYRFVNLIFYALMCILMFLVLNKLTKRFYTSLLAMTIFAIHPVNSLYVLYFWAIEVTFAAIFLMFAIMTFVKYLQTRSKRFYAACILSYLTAILFYETFISFPICLFLIAYFCFDTKRSIKESIIVSIPAFIAAGIYFLLRLKLVSFVSVAGEHQHSLELTVGSFLASMFYLIWWYCARLVSPEGLIFIYSMSPLKNNIFLINALAVVVIGMVLYSVFFKAKRNLFSFLLLWFFSGFIVMPVGMFVMPSLDLVIEPHWFLINSIAFFFLLAVGFSIIRERFSKVLAVGLMILFVLFLYREGDHYNSLWKNEKEFALNWLTIAPDNDMLRYRLAYRLEQEGNYERALEEYQQIISTSGYQADRVLKDMGIIYLKLNNTQKAREYVERSIKVNPEYPLAYNALGTVAIKEGDYDKAIASFEKAIALDMYCINAILNLADTHVFKNDIAKAVQWYEQGLVVEPRRYKDGAFVFNLAQLKYQLGEVDRVIELLNAVLATEYENKEAYLLFGTILGNREDFYGAIKMWEEGRRLAPDDKRFEQRIETARRLLMQRKK